MFARHSHRRVAWQSRDVAPRVSVVIPAHDAAATIGAAISSALWQSFADLEVVVVDDGSTDATAAIASSYGDPVRVVSQPNGGVAAARNRGIAEAAGELIAFCDADDILFEDHLAALVGLHDGHGGIVTANAWWLLPGGIRRGHVRHKGRFPSPGDQRRAILEQNFLNIMSLFPRRLVDEIGPFDEALARAEDWEFWLRAIFAGHPVTHQHRPLALIRWGTTGLSSGAEAMDEAVREVLRRASTRPDLDDDERAYVERALAGPGARVLSREGDRALRAGGYDEATRLYREAAALCPSERRLVWKARALRIAPRIVGPAVRARQVRSEEAIGLSDDHER